LFFRFERNIKSNEGFFGEKILNRKFGYKEVMQIINAKGD
jgi:hypothetical protein